MSRARTGSSWSAIAVPLHSEQILATRTWLSCSESKHGRPVCGSLTVMMGAGGLGARRRTMENRRRRLFSPAERSANAARCAMRCRFSLLMALAQILDASRNF
eukprot:4500119-Pyramimonas_sp.AAC.1